MSDLPDQVRSPPAWPGRVGLGLGATAGRAVRERDGAGAGRQARARGPARVDPRGFSAAPARLRLAGAASGRLLGAAAVWVEGSRIKG